MLLGWSGQGEETDWETSTHQEQEKCKSFEEVWREDTVCRIKAQIGKYTNIVKCIPIARWRVGKHIPAEANARNNRTSVARERSSKHVSLTIEDGVFGEVSCPEDIRRCTTVKGSAVEC
jgi:hypothetical protein